jgi:hypothetical protein
MDADKLENFSIRFLKGSGDIKEKSIQKWHLAEQARGSASGALRDLDGDTSIEVEYYLDEDKIRFFTGGMEETIFDWLGLDQKIGDIAIQANQKVNFEGITGGTYWKYNSTTAYLEGWVDGSKRIEL